jgi:hypothetical protein
VRRTEDQGLAITISLLLLIGGTLLGQRLIGTWPTFAIGVGLVVGGYVLPAVVREIAVRRFARQLRRH